MASPLTDKNNRTSGKPWLHAIFHCLKFDNAIDDAITG
jgi:hypothetical protein